LQIMNLKSMFQDMRIRYKIMMVVGITVTVGLVLTAFFYTKWQEQAVMKQNEQTMRKLTESVISGLRSVMLAGSAEIAHAYADRLKEIPAINDFRILRINGDEAFKDNKTIDDVNRRRGEEVFLPRESETRVSVLSKEDAMLLSALDSTEAVSFYSKDSTGQVLNFLAPIHNQGGCYKCHGKAQGVRGVLLLSTSLAEAELDLVKVRHDSLLVLGLALLASVLLTGYTMGRAVVGPMEVVMNAMARVSGGDLDHKVPVTSKDEIGRMASSFNLMTDEVKSTYGGLRMEQDKLKTIIFGAGEGIVVTDSSGAIVLVNPAAELLLGKSSEEIVRNGFDNLTDDPDTLLSWLASEDKTTPNICEMGERALQVYISTIHANDGKVVGSACLLRDVTEAKRLEDELRRLATTDALTGLFNRRYLDTTLLREFERVERNGSPLSVLIFDVDHFKKFNDTYGHDQGDRVLQAVAKTFAAALRKYDSACRYGGEEFVGILPDTPSISAFTVAERVREAVAATVVDGLQVNISIGVATFPVLRVASPELLLEAADAAMYQSKEGGRNRTTVATAPGEPTA
jgi:diguanylate cyclase (GGDEF)-like protein/PAS domain S-box-containing protein